MGVEFASILMINWLLLELLVSEKLLASLPELCNK
jgi:hypothetical protein